MPTENTLVIATRKSPLALWQARYVKAKLESHHDQLHVEIKGFTTRGDKLLDSPLSKLGGKGLFVKELERAILNREADIAVHSMKDVPMELPEGLELPIICQREDPRDAFVSNRFEALKSLPADAIVGTSSLRRQCQIQAARPDVHIQFLRGNVNSRLAKLDAGDYDAVILAAAGLVRLNMSDRIAERISTAICLPAGGQGAMGIECRLSDERVKRLLMPLHDGPTSVCVIAERALNRRLEGGCQVPIASFAELNDQVIGGSCERRELRLKMRSLVGSVDGKQILTAEGSASEEDAEQLGIQLAEELLSKGADTILREIYGRK